MRIEKEKQKLKQYKYFLILFVVLTFAGMVYILANGGEPDAGYAVIPMVIAGIFGSLTQAAKKNISEWEKENSKS